MSQTVTPLYPAPGNETALSGLYLDEIPLKQSANNPYVYGNFVSSLDGRIGLPSADRDTSGVPTDIGNAHDWRLYQELAAQADVLITSARYFRQATKGEAQDHLPVGPEDRFSDLRAWRKERGLSPQPAVAILSGSLDIPTAALEPYLDRGIHIFTTEQATSRQCQLLEQTGAITHTAGADKRVDGKILVARLFELGFVNQYAIGGPAIFHTLADAAVLNRLYLTFAFRILAGEVFDTLIRGPQLNPSLEFSLRSLYLDSAGPDNCGQLFAAFDTTGKTP